jgi:hypothetical protein
MNDPMKQRTYPQNPSSKRLKVDFGPICGVFDRSRQQRLFTEVNVLINVAAARRRGMSLSAISD